MTHLVIFMIGLASPTSLEGGCVQASHELGDPVRVEIEVSEEALQPLARSLTSHVVELLPGGLLRLEGREEISWSGRPAELTVSGIARPGDITCGEVSSERLMEASVILTSNIQRQRLIRRISTP